MLHNVRQNFFNNDKNLQCFFKEKFSKHRNLILITGTELQIMVASITPFLSIFEILIFEHSKFSEIQHTKTFFSLVILSCPISFTWQQDILYFLEYPLVLRKMFGTLLLSCMLVASPYNLLTLRGRQPLWGTGVTSVTENILSPPNSRPLTDA